MSYDLKLGEPFEKGIRRVLLSQIDSAERRLDTDGEKPEAIHEARKSFKRIRALLRLVRSGIGEATYRRESNAFRDIAGLLAGVRDRHVLLQTIVKLEADVDPHLAAVAAKLKQVLQTPDAQKPATADAAKPIAKARRALKAAGERIERLKLEPNSFKPIQRGIRDTQERSIRAMHLALDEETDEAFHAWRKCVQQHWRHMKLLSVAWPDYFGARIAASKALSQFLGDDHDLSMLTAFASDLTASELTAAEARQIAIACQAQQIALRRQALMVGRTLLADRPKSLGRHVSALWTAGAQNRLLDRSSKKHLDRVSAARSAADGDDKTG